MGGFLADDVREIASANRLPRLNHAHELVSGESASLKSKKKKKDMLTQCFMLHLEFCVREAQRSRCIPQPHELVQFPVFQQAREVDNAYILQENETNERRREEEERLRKEQERIEAERRLERQKEKEALRKKRLESKELRRQERMAAKKESLASLREEKRQRYEEALDAWQEMMREKQDSLDTLNERIKMADSRRKRMIDSLSTIEKEKEALLERLRQVVCMGLLILE